MKRSYIYRGFALPTVMIASVVMLMVLLSGLVAASSVNTSLREQYRNKALSDAVESGRVMAQKCLERNLGVAAWTSNTPPNNTLRPNSNCNGTANGGSQYLLDLKNSSGQTVMRTTFTVSGTVTTDANFIQTVNVTATLDNVRGSGGTTSSSQTQVSSVRVRLTQWKDLVFTDGAQSACALAYDQQIYCWGDNTYGQLGDYTNVSRADARPVYGVMRYKSIVSSGQAYCAISTQDIGYCWGRNREGYLGIGTSADANYPRQVTPGANSTGKWKKIVLLNYSACGIGLEATAGYIYCWGTNYNYVFGNSSIPLNTVSYSPMQAVGSGYQNLAGGSHHVCGYAQGYPLYCWGLRVNSNAYWYCRVPGEPDPTVVDCPGLGNRGYTADPENTGIGTDGNTTDLVSASDDACLLTNGGATYCFGANFKGQLGDAGYGPDDGYGTNSNRNVPYRCVVNISIQCMGFKSVKAGAFSYCGLDFNDEAWCWGMGQFGMHGDGSAGPYTSPTGNHVYNGPSHTVLGSPSVISSTFAVKVSGGMKFRKLFSLNYGYCGMNFSNELYCWGRSQNGAIFGRSGQGTATVYYNYPTLAPNAIKDPPKAIVY